MRENYFQKSDISGSQDLSSAPLAVTTSIGRKFRLIEVNIHFDGATTETITLTKDSAKGANYDTVLRSVDLVAQTDFVFRPSGHLDFQDGDELIVAVTDANGLNVAYYKIKTSAVN